MSMAWMIFEISVNLYQSLLCMYFLKHCVQIHRPSVVKDGLSVLALTGFLTLYLFFDIPFSDVAGGLIHLIWLRSISDDPWYMQTLWITLKEIIIVSVAGIMTQLFMLIVPEYNMLLEPGIIRLLFVVFANLAMSIVFFTLAQLISRKHMQSYAVLAIFFFLNLCILIAFEILFSMQVQNIIENHWGLFTVYGALIVCSILSVVLFYLMSHLARKQREAELSLSHARLTRQHQQVLTDMYTDFIARQHDFKHQLQTLEQLVRDGNAQAAQAHLTAFQSDSNRRSAIITGCLAIDALLTAKQLECEHHHIQLQCTFDPLSRLPMDEVSFCAIVGNLLDNAVEGTLRLPPEPENRWIRLSMKRIQDTFFIHCTNSLLPSSIRQKNGFFLSTKQPDGLPHGYGIQNIRAIIQQLDGFCTFEVKDQRFVASITVPYSKQAS